MSWKICKHVALASIHLKDCTVCTWSSLHHPDRNIPLCVEAVGRLVWCGIWQEMVGESTERVPSVYTRLSVCGGGVGALLQLITGGCVRNLHWVGQWKGWESFMGSRHWQERWGGAQEGRGAQRGSEREGCHIIAGLQAAHWSHCLVLFPSFPGASQHPNTTAVSTQPETVSVGLTLKGPIHQVTFATVHIEMCFFYKPYLTFYQVE